MEKIIIRKKDSNGQVKEFIATVVDSNLPIEGDYWEAFDIQLSENVLSIYDDETDTEWYKPLN